MAIASFQAGFSGEHILLVGIRTREYSHSSLAVAGDNAYRSRRDWRGLLSPLALLRVWSHGTQPVSRASTSTLHRLRLGIGFGSRRLAELSLPLRYDPLAGGGIGCSGGLPIRLGVPRGERELGFMVAIHDLMIGPRCLTPWSQHSPRFAVAERRRRS